MRILVISDTHIPIAADQLPSIIVEEAKKSDYCLHAGDLVAYSVFETLDSLTKTYAVCGNMDQEKIQADFNQQEIITLGEVTLGLIHGGGHPANIIRYVKNAFAEKLDKLDIVIFGHSHCATDETIDEKIYFNPGSPTDKVFTAYRSYGILEINGKEIKREIVKIG